MSLNFSYESSFFIVLSKILINSWVLYLNIRQLCLVASLESVPENVSDYYPQEHLRTAKNYQYEKIFLALMFRCYDTMVFIAEVFGGWIPFIWKVADNVGSNHLAKSLVYVGLSSTFDTLIYLPLKLFNTFVIEQHYGFNRQNLESFMTDQVKEVIAKTIIAMPVVWLTMAIMRWKPASYQFYLMLFALVFRVTLIFVYLEIVFPLVANFKPLPDGTLKNRVKELAEVVDFPLYDIYILQASQYTTHGNAFFVGLGPKKMIVIFDTMLQGHLEGSWFQRKRYTIDEILGILGHEMGHWKRNHIIKSLFCFEVFSCIELYLSSILSRSSEIYTSVGFTPSEQPPEYLGFLVISQLFMLPIGMMLHYISRWMSRQFELEADEFSASLGQADGLMAGLKKITSESLRLPLSDTHYSSYYDTHPTLVNRIKQLMKHKTKYYFH